MRLIDLDLAIASLELSEEIANKLNEMPVLNLNKTIDTNVDLAVLGALDAVKDCVKIEVNNGASPEFILTMIEKTCNAWRKMVDEKC